MRKKIKDEKLLKYVIEATKEGSRRYDEETSALIKNLREKEKLFLESLSDEQKVFYQEYLNAKKEYRDYFFPNLYE